MNRKIYITLGILLNLIELISPIILGSGWGILILYLVLAGYLLITLITAVFNNYCPLSYWFWSASKKIYHDGFGVLYSRVDQEDKSEFLMIYKQRWLYQVLLEKVDYTDDIHTLTTRTKYRLDELYKKERYEKHKYSNFEEWDGYLDAQSKRDDKLNSLGIKQ
jgi:hypothetical protein